ncbi:acyltransferase family protein [Dialister sp. i34-0019-2H8]|uniref:acyltransferase family protein n=1 Tax=Dialister sp. i34-0019-2H8 TaxID=3141190 RepID=UPI0036F26464
MIVGHTVESGGLTRNFIFSFHMPLFFMLSGYTTRLAKDLMECRKHLRKNALHLIGPCLCIGVLSILAQWLKGGNLSLDAFWQITRTTADAYYWVSGVSLPKHPAAGAVWFLFSLFWAKTCMDAISLCFSKKEVALSFWLLACWGFYWAGEENGCHKMQMSRWWQSSSSIWEWFGKSMQKFLIDMSWAFF